MMPIRGRHVLFVMQAIFRRHPISRSGHKFMPLLQLLLINKLYAQ
jgi:hypothetical protein